jgi:hypothetical protein
MKQKDLIFTTPDEELLNDIVGAIKDNGGYCCCAITKTEDDKCMCKKFREQENAGFCHCGRYYKVKNAETVVLIGDCKIDGTEEKINELANTLDGFGFIVTTIKRRELSNLSQHFAIRETNFTKIAKCDLVVVVNEATEFIQEFLEWAAEIGKPVTDTLRLKGDN